VISQGYERSRQTGIMVPRPLIHIEPYRKMGLQRSQPLAHFHMHDTDVEKFGPLALKA